MQEEPGSHTYTESWASGFQLGVRAHAFLSLGSTSGYVTLDDCVLPFTMPVVKTLNCLEDLLKHKLEFLT